MRVSILSSARLAFVVALCGFGSGNCAHAQNEAATKIDLGGGQTLELIRIEPGSFQQGSPPDEAGRGADESPRQVTLTRPFLLGKYPVTRGQFARFVAETRYRTEAESGPSGGFGWDGTQLVQRRDFSWRNPGFPQTDEHPVTIVSYNDAQAFLRWLSGKSGRTFTLPSEAQWEHAARAGTTGPPSADEVAWHKGNSGNATHPVGQKLPNAWGLSDMFGNVWEWCEDWYGPYPPGDATDPLQRNANLSDKPRRVLRGGSWLREAKFCRPAARYRNDAQSRNADNGFRVMSFDLEARAPASAPPVKLESEQHDAPSAPAKSEPRPAPPSSRRGFGLGWLLLLPLVVIGIFILRAIFRGFSGALSATSASGNRGDTGVTYMPGQPLRVRVADDGFWIIGEGIGAGTLLTCRYQVGGGAQQLDVRYEPGPQGQFVFTGARPSNVSVAMIPGARPTSQIGGTADLDVDTNDQPPFQGHPRAY